MKYAILILLLNFTCCLFAQESESHLNIVKDQLPQFPGGDTELLKFLYQNILYPKVASEKGIQGLVIVEFVVNEDGSLSDYKILRDIGGGCGEETIRVLKTMPNWIPAIERGIPIKVDFKLPVRFTISKKDLKRRKKEQKRKMKAEKNGANKKKS